MESADGRFLYSVSELGNDGKSDGSLAAFSIGEQGALKPLNQVGSGGGGPTHIALDKTGKTVFAADFGSGRTTAFRILPDGRVGEQIASMAHSGTGPHRRQAAPHAHAVILSPNNRFVLAPDLGADRVFVYQFDAAAGTLKPHDPPAVILPPGSGPRKLVFHPNGRFAYLLCELTARVTLYEFDGSKGTLLEVETLSALPAGSPGDPSGAGLAIHPNGRFLFTTTRNDTAIEVFAIDQAKGTLTARHQVPAGGKVPWACVIDPTGGFLFVMNQGSDAVAIFRIDAGTGNLTPVGEPLTVPAPACAVFVPA